MLILIILSLLRIAKKGVFPKIIHKAVKIDSLLVTSDRTLVTYINKEYLHLIPLTSRRPSKNQKNRANEFSYIVVSFLYQRMTV